MSLLNGFGKIVLRNGMKMGRFSSSRPLQMFHTSSFERSITSKKKQYENVSNVEMELVSEHVLKLSKEEEELYKEMQKDVVWNAFLAELDGYEDQIWTDVKRRGKELSGDEIEAVKEKIKGKRNELFAKYKNMRKVYAATEEKPKPSQEKQVYEDLAQAFKENVHFINSPEFQSIRDEFFKRTGQSIPGNIDEEYTPQQIEKFMEMLDGEEGKQLEEYMNRVLSDDVFAKMGINAQDYNPLRNPEIMSPAQPSKKKLIAKEEFETLKHSMMADIRKNGEFGMEQFFANETGKTFDSLMDSLYEEMKDEDTRSMTDFLDRAKERNTKK